MTTIWPAEPECASAKVLTNRPRPSLLRVIASKGEHPGYAYRIRRWRRYMVGMSLLHCRETAGLDHLDVLYYEKHRLVTLRPMTEEERREALRRWDGDGAVLRDPVHEPDEAGEPAVSLARAPETTAQVSPPNPIEAPIGGDGPDPTSARSPNAELWGASRGARLSAACALTIAERNAVHERLCRGCVEPVWPYGSATSVNPLLVVLGASPGDSPVPRDADHHEQTPFPLPTVGKPHPRVRYPDKNGMGYWYRVRMLAEMLLDADGTLGEDDALALFGTANLSTKPSGKASDVKPSLPFARWVLETIRDGLRPRVLVLLGLRGLLEKNRELSSLFADTFAGFEARKPHSTYRFDAYQAKQFLFREWNSAAFQGSPLLVVDWPQHASKHPFTIVDYWRAACGQFAARHSSLIG